MNGVSVRPNTKPYRSVHSVHASIVWGKFVPLPARNVCDAVAAGGSGETSAPQGGRGVSRRHRSQTPGVMPRTG